VGPVTCPLNLSSVRSYYPIAWQRRAPPSAKRETLRAEIMSGVAVAIMLMKERQVAEGFERAGITSAERAKAPEELGVGMHGIGWRRLVNRAIVREAKPGLWYLDLPSWQAARRTRRQRSVALLVVVLAAAAFIIFGRAHP
jgi:hypothetical protein